MGNREISTIDDLIAEAREMQETGRYINGTVFHALVDEIDRQRDALTSLAVMGEEGMKPDYNEWLTFHDKVAQIARAALARDVRPHYASVLKNDAPARRE